jgi:DNA polymerase III epsilon subunit-like protein
MGDHYAIGDRNRAFLDTETTGLDPITNEIVEIAIIRERPDGTLIDEWSTKVKPQRIETAHPRALEVNGYNEAAWADAPLFDDIADEVADRLLDCVLIGHNVAFDHGFIKEALKRAGSKVRLPYHKIDTVTLVYEHLAPLGCTSLSLDRVREFLGWSKDGAHTALQDTQDCRKLYHHLTGR